MKTKQNYVELTLIQVRQQVRKVAKNLNFMKLSVTESPLRRADCNVWRNKHTCLQLLSDFEIKKLQPVLSVSC
jgi:hypothetical protein